MRGVNRIRRLVRKMFPVHRIFPRCVILIYHRVYDAFSDPQLLCVSKKNFTEHLEHIQNHYHPMSLTDLGKAISIGKVPRYGVVITFDDGYADNLWNAKPILESVGIPATFFVTSGKLGDEREFWWDDLERLILLPSRLPDRLALEISGNYYTFQTMTSGERQDTYYNLHELLRPLDNTTREGVIAELARWADMQTQGRENYRAMNHKEVAILASGLCEVGAHTVTHSVLAEQTVDFQRYEIFESKKTLEEITGKRVTSFSYPYGSKSDIGYESVSIVKEAGFGIACANVEGIVGRKANPYLLSRCLVRNWDGDEFAKRLRRFLYDSR